jgi:zinc/manganese transport system substrate-binding protein
MEKVKGQPIIQYHGLFNYFLRRFGIPQGVTIERLPGIGPTPRHLELVEKDIKEKKIRLIIQDVYNPDDASKMLSKKMNVRLVVLPHDVGAVSEAKDIFLLFDEIVKRMTND